MVKLTFKDKNNKEKLTVCYAQYIWYDRNGMNFRELAADIGYDFYTFPVKNGAWWSCRDIGCDEYKNILEQLYRTGQCDLSEHSFKCWINTAYIEQKIEVKIHDLLFGKKEPDVKYSLSGIDDMESRRIQSEFYDYISKDDKKHTEPENGTGYIYQDEERYMKQICIKDLKEGDRFWLRLTGIPLGCAYFPCLVTTSSHKRVKHQIVLNDTIFGIPFGTAAIDCSHTHPHDNSLLKVELPELLKKIYACYYESTNIFQFGEPGTEEFEKTAEYVRQANRHVEEKIHSFSRRKISERPDFEKMAKDMQSGPVRIWMPDAR